MSALLRSPQRLKYAIIAGSMPFWQCMDDLSPANMGPRWELREAFGLDVTPRHSIFL
jgi:hypothetical protein